MITSIYPDFESFMEYAPEAARYTVGCIGVALVVSSLVQMAWERVGDGRIVYDGRYNVDSPAFNHAYHGAYPKLNPYVEGGIDAAEAALPELNEKLREKVNKGICLGCVSELYNKMYDEPEVSPTELVRQIKLQDAVFKQMLYCLTEFKKRDDPDVTELNAPTKFDYSNVLPWNETFFYLDRKEVESDQAWVAKFESKFAGREQILCRVSYKIDKLLNHTTAFWVWEGEIALMDNRVVYHYDSLTSLFRDLRVKMLKHRETSGEYADDAEREKYIHFPAIIFERYYS